MISGSTTSLCHWNTKPTAKRRIKKERLGVPYGIRTRVTAVKGRCPRPLDEEDEAASNSRTADERQGAKWLVTGGLSTG